MTAIGVSLMLVGLAIYKLTDDALIEDIAVKLWGVGMFTTSLGVIVWLWNVMP